MIKLTREQIDRALMLQTDREKRVILKMQTLAVRYSFTIDSAFVSSDVVPDEILKEVSEYRNLS